MLELLCVIVQKIVKLNYFLLLFTKLHLEIAQLVWCFMEILLNNFLTTLEVWGNLLLETIKVE